MVSLGATGASASAAPAAAVAAVQAGWSYVPDYATSPALASGTVVDPGGAPLPQATVVVFPVPLDIAAGTTLTPIARASTDSSGSFTLHLPDAARPGLITSRDAGSLNLHVMAFYPGGIAQWFYTVPPAAGASAGQSASAAPAQASVPSARLVLHSTPATATPAGQGAAVSPNSCEANGGANLIQHVPVVVGMKESAATNLASTIFSYSTSTSMTLGAGISYSSSDSGFSADGTITRTSGGSYTWPSLPSASNNDLEGSGSYHNQRYVCQQASNSYQYWVLSPYSVGGEVGTPGTPEIPAGDCIPTQHGSTNVFTSGTQQTFSAGVKLTVSGFGINLSSQSGFSSGTSLAYNMGSQGHPICGQGSPPGSGPVGVLEVHSSVTPGIVGQG